MPGPHDTYFAQEERSALEAKVTAQLEDERAALLGRKRAEQAARRRAQDDLERILAENQRKVWHCFPSHVPRSNAHNPPTDIIREKLNI